MGSSLLISSLVSVVIATNIPVVDPKITQNRFGNVAPVVGFVPDEATAAAIAEAILYPLFGEEVVKGQLPFSARLEGDIWVVKGHWYAEPGKKGGVAEVRIMKSSGEIVKVEHGM